MFVVDLDQRGSRRGTDQVPALLDRLRDVPALRAFERTVGDEVQGVLDDPDDVVRLVLGVLRAGGWSVGVGAGPVDEPLPASPREGSGAAFVLAREAVEAAKSRARPVSLAVRGAQPGAAADAEALLTLLAAVRARRTPAGWAVVDALEGLPDGTAHGGPDALARPRPAAAAPAQEDLAQAFGISQQAVSQRLRAALRAEEVALHPLAARLLTQAGG